MLSRKWGNKYNRIKANIEHFFHNQRGALMSSLVVMMVLVFMLITILFVMALGFGTWKQAYAKFMREVDDNWTGKIWFSIV